MREIAPVLIIGLLCTILVSGASPYRVKRMTAFQNFDVNNLNTTSYHTKQIVIALGSGGLTGVGIGNSVQKYAYLPEHTTDSIFAIFAEEAGYIGSVILISLYVLLCAIGIVIAMNAKTHFGKLLATGITVFLAIQTIINLSSQAILIPLTGVPLPFISYGGSSMLINFVAIGLLLNIALDRSSGPRKNGAFSRVKNKAIRGITKLRRT
jgi:cell division protein FtsW